MKNLKSLGKSLNRDEQKAINGGKFGAVTCLAPYFKAHEDEPCIPGYHPHPTMPHCICCRD